MCEIFLLKSLKCGIYSQYTPLFLIKKIKAFIHPINYKLNG